MTKDFYSKGQINLGVAIAAIVILLIVGFFMFSGDSSENVDMEIEENMSGEEVQSQNEASGSADSSSVNNVNGAQEQEVTTSPGTSGSEINSLKEAYESGLSLECTIPGAGEAKYFFKNGKIRQDVGALVQIIDESDIHQWTEQTGWVTTTGLSQTIIDSAFSIEIPVFNCVEKNLPDSLFQPA